MFSHLYITSKVLKNISISITHGFVSIVSCRGEPSLAPSITTHHHCAESAYNGHSLKTIEGLIWNKRSFCSHGPITDYSSNSSSTMLWSRCRNLILGPNSLQYLHHPAITCLYVRSFKSNNQIFLSVEVVTFSPDVCWVLWDLLLHCFCCLKVWSKFYDALLGFCLNKHFLEKQDLNMTSCGTFLASLWLFQILLMLWKRPC